MDKYYWLEFEDGCLLIRLRCEYSFDSIEGLKQLKERYPESISINHISKKRFNYIINNVTNLIE
jgi:hypothetical protein